MLGALFARRQVLPAKELVDLMRLLWGGEPSDAWRRLEELVENGFLRRMTPRHWRGSASR